METATFIKNGNYRLFGILHAPAKTAAKFKNFGVVICHPFAEEKLISHRVLVKLARRLADEGICCLRFDHRGHGDSDGDFEEADVPGSLSDIRRAVDYLKRETGVERIGLAGVRFGGTLAALSGAENSDINSLALIAPIIDGSAYIGQCLRSNLATQTALFKTITKNRKDLVDDLMAGRMVNIDGYLLTKKMYEDMEKINLLDTPAAFQSALIIQISRKENQEVDNPVKQLESHYKNQGVETEAVSIKDDFFWTDTRIYDPDKKNIQDAMMRFFHRIIQ